MYGKEFLRAEDLQNMLGIGRTRALDIMHMFIQNGSAFVYGRVYRVRAEIFHAWHSPQEELKPIRQFRVIKGGSAGDRLTFIAVADIRRILDVSQTTALTIMHDLLDMGKAVQYQRIYRIRIDVFYDWLAEFDGYKPAQCLRAI